MTRPSVERLEALLDRRAAAYWAPGPGALWKHLAGAESSGHSRDVDNMDEATTRKYHRVLHADKHYRGHKHGAEAPEATDEAIDAYRKGVKADLEPYQAPGTVAAGVVGGPVAAGVMAGIHALERRRRPVRTLHISRSLYEGRKDEGGLQERPTKPRYRGQLGGKAQGVELGGHTEEEAAQRRWDHRLRHKPRR